MAPVALLGLSLSTVHAQTAFTYQGQLLQAGNPASGIYNLTFSLFSVSSGGSAVAGPFTVDGVNVSNGLFTVAIDFGSGVFYGQPRWLEVGVETNGGASFDTLTPRLLLTPAPLSIYAANAAAAASATNWSGSVSGDVLGTQGATVVASVGGQTAASVASGVLAANGATSNNVPGTLVARDATGSFSAGSITLSGGLYLPYPATIYSGSNTLLIDQGSLFLGHPAGGHGATGLGQTGIGDDVLISGSSGNYNTALGEQAMQYNTSGDQNTANGYQALQGNTIGQLNTAIGAFALLDNASGTFNTAIGGQTLQFNTTSSGNTAVGYQALFSNTTGGSNTANGFYALVSNSGGSYDTANGVFALEANSSGTYNTADGAFALANNTSGSNNTAIGGQALQNNTIGSDNTASGLSALSRNTNGSANTANGAFALANNTIGSANTAIGAQALQANTSGAQNTANGDLALFSNTSGSNNTANGSGALYANTSGSFNTADGLGALGENTTGIFNTALGYGAGGNIITGSFNIDIGNQGFSTDGYIIRIGAEGTQTNAFVAGIYGTTIPANSPFVVVDSSGQLGAENAVPSAGLSGTYGNSVTFNNANNSFTGSFGGNGANLTNVNATTLDGYGYCNLPCYWNLTGNAGTTPGINFVGTTDNTALELHVNNIRALLLQPANNQPNLIGGGLFNFVAPGVTGSTIAGGNSNTIQSASSYSFLGGGFDNYINAQYATLGGGTGNNVNAGANFAFIGGGSFNTVSSYAGTVGGGTNNNAGYLAAVAGGAGNTAGILAAVGGGNVNVANGVWTFIGGGANNTASGDYATVPGGYSNLASGEFSFAAGQEAGAVNQGAFVWADSQSGAFASTGNNQFLIRAGGGVGIGTNGPLAPLHAVGNRTGDSSMPIALIENLSTNGPTSGSPSASALRVLAHGGPTDGALSVSTDWAAGGTNATNVLIARFGNANTYVSALDNNGNWTALSFNPSSDRNTKENFESISPREVLDKVSKLPITRWNYKVDKDCDHIGPMAQDFWTAFKVGLDDKHIATVDEEGVALAAIQGLNQKVEEQTAALIAKDAMIQSLEQRLERLEKLASNPPDQR